MRKTNVFILLCFLILATACQKEENDFKDEELSLRGDTAEEGDGSDGIEEYPCWDGIPNNMKVLFIGNSFTANYTVDIPTMFKELSLASGRSISTVAKSAILGFTLNQHLTHSTTQGLIDQGDWDYVILQENSGFLANASGAANTFTNSVNSMVQKIVVKSPSAKILLYQIVPPVDHNDLTFDLLNDEWDLLFEDVASSHSNVSVTRVAQAFDSAYNNFGSPGIFGGSDILRLSVSYQFHFMNAGGFMTAVTFYSDIFNDKPCVPDEMTFWLGGSSTGLDLVVNRVDNLEEILQVGYIEGILSTPYNPPPGNCPVYAMYGLGYGPCD